MLQVHVIKEPNGTSRVNAHNITLIISTIKVLRVKTADKKYELRNNQIGIVSPYNCMLPRFEPQDEHCIEPMNSISASESQNPGEAGRRTLCLLISCGPKRTNLGALGFLAKKERLNVLLSCQEQFLFVVGDMECCESSFETSQPVNQPNATTEPANEPVRADDIWGATWNRHDKRNAWILKVLAWFREHGRAIQVPMTAITEDYITFPKDEKDGGGAVGGCGNDEEKQDEQDEQGKRHEQHEQHEQDKQEEQGEQEEQDGQDEQEKLTELMKQGMEKLQKQLDKLQNQFDMKIEKQVKKPVKKKTEKQIEKQDVKQDDKKNAEWDHQAIATGGNGRLVIRLLLSDLPTHSFSIFLHNHRLCAIKFLDYYGIPVNNSIR